MNTAEKYKIEFAPAAAKQLRKLPQDVQGRIVEVIDKLSNNPLPTGVKKLADKESLYRVRVSDYRVIYHFFLGRLIISYNSPLHFI